MGGGLLRPYRLHGGNIHLSRYLRGSSSIRGVPTIAGSLCSGSQMTVLPFFLEAKILP